jgi:hypothetical protein
MRTSWLTRAGEVVILDGEVLILDINGPPEAAPVIEACSAVVPPRLRDDRRALVEVDGHDAGPRAAVA